MSIETASTLVVWGIGTPRTFRAHWILEELELEYETRPVQSRTGETQSAAFLRMNPKGKIPVLADGERVLSESGAILNYLAERYGADMNLIPPAHTAERADYDQWCFFVLMELDATSLYVMRRHQGLPDVYGEAPNAVTSAAAYFQRQAQVIDDHLAEQGPNLLGETFSCADILLTSCLDMARFFGIPLTDKLETYRRHQSRRSAYQRAFDQNYPPEIKQALNAGIAK